MKYLGRVEYSENNLTAHESYCDFLAARSHSDAELMDKTNLPDFLYPFQSLLTSWSLARGRAAIFADCGLGKTPMQLVWANKIKEKTNKPVLILTPLAVSFQTIQEGHKFGIDCKKTSGNIPGGADILVSNYEKLHHFDPTDFSGVVCDESSIMKNFNGKRRTAITEFMKKVQYRLLCTATPSPNDYIELGTSSEAIGEMGYMDMLTRFFKHDQNSNHPNRRWANGNGWRFRGHSEDIFWQWVCSWARSIRMPSDLGFSDNGFILPPLIENEHIVSSTTPPSGLLFTLPAKDMREERDERRRTIKERCEKAAELVANSEPAIVWCHLNKEGDLLEALIPDGKQISGADSDDKREETYLAFTQKQIRVIIIKPKIGAWGLNWQHCNHIVTFVSHSYEQYYQSIRRCWRFGQQNPVTVDIISTEGELRVKENMKRKAIAANKMFERLVRHMSNPIWIDRKIRTKEKTEVPMWM